MYDSQITNAQYVLTTDGLILHHVTYSFTQQLWYGTIVHVHVNTLGRELHNMQTTQKSSFSNSFLMSIDATRTKKYGSRLAKTCVRVFFKKVYTSISRRVDDEAADQGIHFFGNTQSTTNVFCTIVDSKINKIHKRKLHKS